MRYRRLLGATFVMAAAAALTTLGTGAASAAPAMPAAPPPPCAAGYTVLFITNGSDDLYLDTEGAGNPVEAAGAGSCWHPPASLNTGTITNTAGLCLDWDQAVGVNVMAACDGALSEKWTAGASGGSVVYANNYPGQHGSDAVLLHAELFQSGSDVNLADTVGDQDEWHT